MQNLETDPSRQPEGGPSDALNARLIEMIVNSLKTQEKLPPEKQMMCDLGVSRTLLREALSFYEASGIIQVRQGSGRYASLPDVSAQIVSMWSIVIRIDPTFILELLDVRSILELSMLPKVVEHAQLEHLQEMERLVLAMEKHVKAGETYVAEDRAFHLTMCSAVKNRPLLQLISAFWDVFDHAKLGVRHEGLDEVVAQHRQMMEAIAKQDSERLTKVTRQQLADARYRIIRQLTEQGVPGLGDPRA